MRRAQHIAAENGPIIQEPTPDPIQLEKPTSGWKILLGVVCAVGLGVLAIMGGATTPPSNSGFSGGSGQ